MTSQLNPLVYVQDYYAHTATEKNIRVCVCRLSDYIQLYVAQCYTVEVTVICNMFDLDTTAIKLLNICHSSIINANLI